MSNYQVKSVEPVVVGTDMSLRWPMAMSFPGIITARARTIISCCEVNSPSRPGVLIIATGSLSAKDLRFHRVPPTAFPMNRHPNVSSYLSKE